MLSTDAVPGGLPMMPNSSNSKLAELPSKDEEQGRDWWKFAVLATSALAELDPANRGVLAERVEQFRQRDERREEQARRERVREYMENLAPGFGDLSPQERAFVYDMQRDQTADQQWKQTQSWRREDRQNDLSHRDRVFDRENAWRDKDFAHRDRVYDRNILESDRSFDLAQDQFDLQSRVAESTIAKNNAAGSMPTSYRPANADEIAQYGYDPETTTAQIGPRGEFKLIKQREPMISSENMARVASNLPNLVEAKDNLSELFTTQQDGMFSPKKGYRPGHDWGARAISAIPDFGLLEGAAKWVGGKDYQTYETEYAAFEAAALPIVSGSAVSESEGRRFLNSIKIQMGDNDATVARKLRAKENFVAGLQAAATGDSEMLGQVIAGTYDPNAFEQPFPNQPIGTGTVIANDPPRISSPEQLAALPPGTEYMAPDGTVRRKR